jgi:hypothetical protein
MAEVSKGQWGRAGRWEPARETREARAGDKLQRVLEQVDFSETAVPDGIAAWSIDVLRLG